MSPRTSVSPARPILVGIGGSGHGWAALDWACVRAQSGGASLRVVLAFRWPRSADPTGIVFRLDVDPVRLAQNVVDTAAERVKAVAPGLPFTTTVLMMGPVAALTREGRLAELIVVGRARQGRPFLPCTVASRVARRNRGRVVIVDRDDEVLV